VYRTEDPPNTPAPRDQHPCAPPPAPHDTNVGAAHLANVDRANAFTAALLDHLEAP
jgi:hypothetical protein